MALQKVSRSLLNTGVADSSDATAITIDSSENVTFAGTTQTTRLGLGVAPHGTAALNITSTAQHMRLNNGSELGIISLESDGALRIWSHGDSSNNEIEFYQGSGSGSASMTINGSGKVGIGKTPSTWFLDVDSTNGYIASFDGSNNTGVAINSSSSIADIIGYSNSASSYNALNIRAASGTGLVVNTSNNVGIGTTSPSSKLQIIGGTSGIDQIHLASNLSDNTNKFAGIIMTMYTNNTAALIGGLALNGNTTLVYGSSGTDHRGVTKHIWYTNTNYNSTSGNTIRAQLDSDGLKFNGDTAAANALDDYEEGTWTPALTAGSPSYSVQSGRYTKIGNIVRLRCAIKLSGWSNATGGEVTVTGIPFSSTTGAYDHDWGAVHVASKPHSHTFVCGVDTNNVFFRREDVTNADYGMVGTQVDADTAIMFTVTYQTS